MQVIRVWKRDHLTQLDEIMKTSEGRNGVGQISLPDRWELWRAVTLEMWPVCMRNRILHYFSLKCKQLDGAGGYHAGQSRLPQVITSKRKQLPCLSHFPTSSSRESRCCGKSPLTMEMGIPSRTDVRKVEGTWVSDITQSSFSWAYAQIVLWER